MCVYVRASVRVRVCDLLPKEVISGVRGREDGREKETERKKDGQRQRETFPVA